MIPARVIDETSFAIDDAHRGVLKQAFIGPTTPAHDLAGYTAGHGLAGWPSNSDAIGPGPFRVRDYQKGAVDAFYAGGDVRAARRSCFRAGPADRRRFGRDGRT